MACIPAASQLQAVLSAAARALASSTAADATADGAAACSHFLPRRAPKDTAAALMRELSELDRIHLVLALQRSTSKEQLKQAETHYVDDLVKQVSVPINQQHAKLTRVRAVLPVSLRLQARRTTGQGSGAAASCN